MLRYALLLLPRTLTCGEHLKTKIEEATYRKVGISFVIRDFANEKFPKKHPPQDLRWLKEHDVQVVQVPNLHSKIYLNERTVLVSSMNITEPSIANSREFAMIVKGEEDAKKLREYVSRLVEKFALTLPAHSTGQQAVKYASSPIRNSGSMQRELSAGPRTGKTGTCIRCGANMAFNKERPLCDKDYRNWARFKKEDYPEKHCHSCGKLAETTYAKPLCLNCWKREAA
jgi:hypothetical protein